MAQQVILVDDLTGGTADETVTFAIDGITYDIDLITSNANALRAALDPYITAGRPTGKTPTTKAKTTTSTTSKPSTRAGRLAPGEGDRIRNWARDNGYDVSDRGRISTDIRDAYNAANPT
jgi:hypothetical protein